MKFTRSYVRLLSHLFIILAALISAPLAAQQRPNVIFILSDDQGSVDAGCYGSTDLQTPNIDRIAKEGVRFTQFYSNAPICSPSRAAILTGKTPYSAGVPGNAGSSALSKQGLPSAEVTLAEVFKDNGYRTAAIGKWHLGYQKNKQPLAQGFDHSFGHLVGCIDNYSHFYYWNGPNRHDLFKNGKEIFRDGEYFPEMCLNEAKEFITAEADRPFFIYYAMNTPHYPYQGHANWLEYYDSIGVEYPRNLYNAFLSTQDEYVGKLLDHLEQLGLTQETIVVFQSDHGHSTEERAHFGGGSAGPYRGAKGSLFEGGLRVPAIISWPGHLPAEEVRDHWCLGSDWYSTLGSICDLNMPNHDMTSQNLTAIIEDAQAEEVHHVWHWNFQDRWSVRSGNWKLLYDPLDTSLTRRPEPNAPEDEYFLVDLSQDIGEQENLAQEFPDRVKELTELYFQRKSEEQKPYTP